MKTEKLQHVLNHFDGAALHTMRKLTTEEQTLLVEYINSLGARGGVPTPRPQSNDRN